MKYLGIDIGTTTICGVILDENKEVIKSITKDNTSEIKSDLEYERIQDPETTFTVAKKITDELIDNFPDVLSIGVSGQMHGIVYCDRQGNAVSPLYYWQDKRALNIYENNKSYVDYLRDNGVHVSAGYGGASHFYNVVNNLVPSSANTFCTIGDYIVMKLTDNTSPLVHSSQAASIGFYDLKSLCFDKKSIEAVSLKYDLFPDTCIDNQVVGSYRNIPVCVSLGDNQASFLGSKTPNEGILINVGTGSQISLVSSYTETENGVELRPLNKHEYLLVGAAICGGKSYAILKSFFEKCALLFNVEIKDMYSLMNSCVGEDKLVVDTKFLGTRIDPAVRGSITNIDDKNFTPENLVKAFNKGMANELYELYELMGTPKKSVLIGSGNGCRFNRNFVKEVENIFKMNLQLSDCKEEAASGAAIFTQE